MISSTDPHASGPGSELSGTRVLLIITGLTLGGAELQVVSLAKAFAERGLYPAVMSMVSNGTTLKESLIKVGIPVFELGMTRGQPSFGGLIRAARFVRNFRPKIVHSHMFHSNLLARFLRLISPIPALICTAHNSDEGGRLNMLLYRSTHFLSEITTNVSTLAARTLEHRGAAPKDSIVTVHNGIDTDTFLACKGSRARIRATLGLSSDQFVFLAAGRLCPQKDYENLLVAMRHVANELPQSRLIIAGTGELQTSLKLQCRELGLDGCVSWLGERTDVHDLMKAVDAFVLSSKYEGFGLVIAEAMAAELPVIATACLGPEEIIGDLGYVVPVSNATAMAEAMIEVFNLPHSKRNLLGSLARQRIVESFSLHRAVTRWLEIYAAMLTEMESKRRTG